MPTWSSRAKQFVQATQIARSLKESTLVVKLGGSALEDAAIAATTFDTLAALHQLGLRFVIVHGGGKPIDRAMAESGLTPRKVAGRRVTDRETLNTVVRVLRAINRDICAALTERGCDAACELPIHAEKLKFNDEQGFAIDLGYVGTPVCVNADDLEDFATTQQISVIPSFAYSHDGGLLNINADTAAAAVAGALRSEVIYFLTDTPGVLARPDDHDSVLPELTVASCHALIADGTIAGGMIPKVEACLEALAAGAKRAVIVDGRHPYALLTEFLGERFPGTEVLP